MMMSEPIFVFGDLSRLFRLPSSESKAAGRTTSSAKKNSVHPVNGIMMLSSTFRTVTMADSPDHPLPPPPQLISATAPGKLFASRIDLQNHYKSDWHKYNLRRRSSGLPMLNESDFTARLEAALALRREKEEREGKVGRNGVGHRKDKDVARLERQQPNLQTKEKQQHQRGKNRRRKPAFATERFEVEDIAFSQEEDGGKLGEDDHNSLAMDEGNDNDEAAAVPNDDKEDVDEEPPEINPCQSLFDNHISSTPQDNLIYLQKHFSFYLPDSEYCIDLEGFLGYCNEKIRLGNICLYCQKTFKGGAHGVIRHMKDKEHCKILYERNVDMEEYDVFYDFSTMPGNYVLGEKNKKAAKGGGGGEEEGLMFEKKYYNEDEEEWEDVSSDDEDASMKDDEEQDDDDLYVAYQEEISSRGFDITPLGELIFPDGRIVGHRALARYYKQRFAPDRMEREAVRHARVAAADRLYDGRVVNLYQLRNSDEDNIASTTSNSLANSTVVGRSHLPSRSIPIGRGGNGILVSGGSGSGGFTSLSLYRYRAAIKKQRREDARGQRLQYRSRMNTNKMDKKGNNISTGVVTAMMPR
jgi:pre-60S factor REI1